MNIYIKAALGLLAVLLIVLAIVKIVRAARKRRERAEAQKRSDAREQEQLNKAVEVVQAWVDGITNATTDKQILSHVTHYDLTDSYYTRRVVNNDHFPGYVEARSLYVAAERRKQDRKEINAFNTRRKRAVGADEAVVLLAFKHNESRLFEMATGLSVEQTGELIVELVLADLELARAGDANALRRFLSFRRVQSKNVLGVYAPYSWLEARWDDMAFPEEWNDMVTEMIESPSLRDFEGVSHEPQPGMVRQMAAQALQERSLYLGKVVLAYCSVTEDVLGDTGYRSSGRSRQRIWPYKQEIGDVLLADVTKMVHAIHVEQKLFAGF